MLANAGYRFDVAAADIDEAALKAAHLSSGLAGDKLALALANAKAEAIAGMHASDLVIGSDQVLTCNGKVFSKVNDMPQAARQLSELQGRTHRLVSAVACWRGNQPVFEAVEQAEMSMYRLTSEEIDQYLAETGPAVLGSVGCYQIEGKGVRLFEQIAGSHFAIMGMPLIPLVKFLRGQGEPQ